MVKKALPVVVGGSNKPLMNAHSTPMIRGSPDCGLVELGVLANKSPFQSTRILSYDQDIIMHHHM